MSTDKEQLAESTLIDHLMELRTRLLYSVLALLAGFLIAYPFAAEIYAFLAAPLVRVLPEKSQLIFTSLPEVFFTYIKVSLVAGVFLALPVLLYQFWAFVAPGLYRHERNTFFPLIFISVFLFILGALFAYYLIFPLAFQFFVGFAGDDIAAMPAVNSYLNLALTLILAFGGAFQIPVVTVVLLRLGIVDAETLKSSRSYVVVGCFVVAAVVTPPDVISQILLAVPMYLMFEIGLFFGQRVPKAVAGEVEEEDYDADRLLDEIEAEMEELKRSDSSSS